MAVESTAGLLIYLKFLLLAEAAGTKRPAPEACPGEQQLGAVCCESSIRSPRALHPSGSSAPSRKGGAVACVARIQGASLPTSAVDRLSKETMHANWQRWLEYAVACFAHVSTRDRQACLEDGECRCANLEASLDCRQMRNTYTNLPSCKSQVSLHPADPNSSVRRVASRMSPVSPGFIQAVVSSLFPY